MNAFVRPDIVEDDKTRARRNSIQAAILTIVYHINIRHLRKAGGSPMAVAPARIYLVGIRSIKRARQTTGFSSVRCRVAYRQDTGRLSSVANSRLSKQTCSFLDSQPPSFDFQPIRRCWPPRPAVPLFFSPSSLAGELLEHRFAAHLCASSRRSI